MTSPPPFAKRAPRPWLFYSKILGALFLVATVCFYLLENYLGARAWRRVLAEMRAAAAPTSVAELAGPPVPNKENFADLPLLRPLFAFDVPLSEQDKPFPEARWRDPAGIDALAQLPGASAERGGWSAGRFTDLDALAKRNYLAGEREPGAELLTLSKAYDPVMDQLREGLTRRQNYIPLHTENLARYADLTSPPTPHLEAIEGLMRQVAIRALAELSLGQTERAASEIISGLRLAECLDAEPLLSTQLARVRALEELMQPIWEGQVRHRWKEAELAALETALRRHDMIGAYRRAVRGESLAYAQLCDLAPAFRERIS